MRRFQFRRITLAFSILISLAAATSAQSRSAEEREREWNAYALPSSAFSRQTDPAKSIVFRVPVDWKPQGQLSFAGPQGSQLAIIVENIPEGIPLKAYFAARLRELHDIPGGPDALTIRRTNLSGIEAREISFELPDVRGTIIRRVLWMAVDGPKAVAFFFSTPVARAAEIEPYFKATVLSTLFLRSVIYNEEFELYRQSRFPQSGPARIDEMLSLVPALDGLDESARSKAITRLAEIFSSAPDQAIDLLIDRRPMVRAAVIDAMEKSRNPALTDFILQAIVDRETYVSNHAALALARQQDPVALLRRRFGNWAVYDYPYFLRATSMLDKKSRIQIASELLKAPKTPPPPEIKPPAGKPAKPPNDKLIRPPAGGIPGGGPVGFIAVTAQDLNLRFLALNLLGDVAASEFAIPIADVIAAKENSFTLAALQLALDRREALPAIELLKLLSHPNDTIAMLAADCLALSARPADIPRIEAIIEKLSPPKKDSPTTISGGFINHVTDEIKLTIEKIRLRERLSTADADSRRSLIAEAMKDKRLADWVWIEFTRDETEGRRKPHDAPVSSNLRISPMGENLFPADVRFYTALPNPAATLSNFAESFNNIHMDTARGQAMMALMVSSFKENFARFFGLESSRQELAYLGIDMTAPWAMASWTAEGAPTGLKSAERKAVILKVSDRDRFERVLALYQQRVGNFSAFPDRLSIGSRAIGFIPAILPLGGALALGSSAPPRPFSPLRYDLMREEECLGHKVKVIERREVGFMGRIRNDSAYLVYINDVALIAPDWYSIRDALTRLSKASPAIGASPQFKRAMESKGDVIYLSNIGNLFSPEDKTTRIMESGSLTVSNASWENTFRISLDDKEWTKKLRPFQAADLLAPRRLLPRTTFAYIFLKPDLAAMSKDAKSSLLTDIDIKQIVAAFAPEIQLQVLSEIEGEAGAALLSFPSFDKGFDAQWIFFFRLRGEKTSAAFANGKLFKEATAPSKPARIKTGKREIIAAVKNGFLVFAGSEETIASLDANEKLDVARDFAKAAEKAPPNVIAFGGYNLEAATALLASLSRDPETKQLADAISSMIRAFHSQNFYALASESGIDARMSVSMDREGRYSVSELPLLAKEFDLNFAVMEPRGMPIADQSRLERLKIRIKAKGEGSADQVRQDVTNDHQRVEQAGGDLIVTVRPRQSAPDQKIQLPVSSPEFAPFLAPAPGINSTNESIIAQAREIAGNDRDAWSVAQKLSDWTYKNLKWKRVDSADAAQTLATREADCVEFSELFIAMARSLGLPARMVSGLAYGDSSFGAHAWVEVHVGRWIEIDPTFGTNFVDATHIRSESGDLIRYAALNLLDLEVMEAPRAIPDYQRDAKILADTICKEISKGSSTALSLSLDMSVVVDLQMGAGAWERMSAPQRDKMLSSHRRLVSEIEGLLREENDMAQNLRLLSVKISADRAEAYAIRSEILETYLFKFEFALKGDVWMLAEVTEMDRDLRIVNEVMRLIVEQRDGKSGSDAMSPFLRSLTALGEDAKVALEIIDKALAENPKDRPLRFVKAQALFVLEKMDEAKKQLDELTREEPPYLPALLDLANILYGEETERARAIELYERYTALMPVDPRPHESLAELFIEEKNFARAEAAYRAALARDSSNVSRYSDLAGFLMRQMRFDEAMKAIDEAVAHGGNADELMADLIASCWDGEQEIAEKFAASQPARMSKNAGANLQLGYLRLNSEQAAKALPLFRKAAELKPDMAEAHSAISNAYRDMGNYRAALASADKAIRIDAEYASAHYNRACALARLGRKTEALAALKRAIEIDDYYAIDLEEAADLKSLAAMPEFKKLVELGKDG